MGKFFIGRPIVAIVISILIVMIGVATILSLCGRAVSVSRATEHSRDC